MNNKKKLTIILSIAIAIVVICTVSLIIAFHNKSITSNGYILDTLKLEDLSVEFYSYGNSYSSDATGKRYEIRVELIINNPNNRKVVLTADNFLINFDGFCEAHPTDEYGEVYYEIPKGETKLTLYFNAFQGAFEMDKTFEMTFGNDKAIWVFEMSEEKQQELYEKYKEWESKYGRSEY